MSKPEQLTGWLGFMSPTKGCRKSRTHGLMPGNPSQRRKREDVAVCHSEAMFQIKQGRHSWHQMACLHFPFDAWGRQRLLLTSGLGLEALQGWSLKPKGVVLSLPISKAHHLTCGTSIKTDWGCRGRLARCTARIYKVEREKAGEAAQ